ncbi:MAG: peptidoglycan editing factor PgeF [Anaerolineales bacterium]
MPFVEIGGLRVFQFENLSLGPVTQAVATRQGGVSEGPYAKLNVGISVGDDPARVAENIERIFVAMGRPRASMFDSFLVHGAGALVAGGPRPAEWGKPPQGDIILTNKPNVTLFMRYADCVPLLYVDPVKRALALAHAGWRGTLLKVAAKAVDEMRAHYGSRPQDLLVGIGPAISVQQYEVGPEVVAQVQTVFGQQAAELLPQFNGSTHLDLVAANLRVLEAAGVRNIEQAGLCTFDNQQDWFSHRGAGGKTGRFGVLLALK